MLNKGTSHTSMQAEVESVSLLGSIHIRTLLWHKTIDLHPTLLYYHPSLRAFKNNLYFGLFESELSLSPFKNGFYLQDECNSNPSTGRSRSRMEIGEARSRIDRCWCGS